jgi:hypothetical protein
MKIKGKHFPIELKLVRDFFLYLHTGCSIILPHFSRSCLNFRKTNRGSQKCNRNTSPTYQIRVFFVPKSYGFIIISIWSRSNISLYAICAVFAKCTSPTNFSKVQVWHIESCIITREVQNMALKNMAIWNLLCENMAFICSKHGNISNFFKNQRQLFYISPWDVK